MVLEWHYRGHFLELQNLNEANEQGKALLRQIIVILTLR